MSYYYQLGLYKYKDKASYFSSLPDALKGERMVASCAIIQLLMGKLNVYDENEKLVYRSKTNYIELPYKEYKPLEKVNDYKDYLIAFGVDAFDEKTTERINVFLRADLRNSFVYEHILYELTLALSCLKTRPTEAFVHIYRTLEFISYTFPLIYTAKSNDYLGSFDCLKGFFSGGNSEGELKFFEKFLDMLFQDDKEMYDFVFEILIDSDKLKEVVCDFRKSIQETGKKGIPNYYIETNTLQIQFKNMQGILTDIRNRYFHMLVGKGTKNFYGINYDINDLFKSVNPYFINWIASIYSKIIQYRLESM